MRVTVFGGTGAIGFHAVRAVAARGHEVTAVARTPPGEGVLPSRVGFRRADVLARDADLDAHVTGADALVVAVGPDDRRTVRRPASRVYDREIPAFTQRVLEAARRAEVRFVVIAGTYFTHLLRREPALRNDGGAPYLRARHAQARIALTAGSAPSVVLLELPFVFGPVPGRRPLWAPVVRYARSRLPLLAVRGGSTMVGAETVAEAMANGVEGRVPTGAYPIGERFLPWTTWLETLARMAGQPRPARRVPDAWLQLGVVPVERWTRARGREHGMDRMYAARLVTRNLEISPADLECAHRRLGVRPRGLDAALEATVAACP